MPQLDFLVCYTNVGHSNFRCYLKKIISDITAFEPCTLSLASLLVEHIGNVTVDF